MLRQGLDILPVHPEREMLLYPKLCTCVGSERLGGLSSSLGVSNDVGSNTEDAPGVYLD